VQKVVNQRLLIIKESANLIKVSSFGSSGMKNRKWEPGIELFVNANTL